MVMTAAVLAGCSGSSQEDVSGSDASPDDAAGEDASGSAGKDMVLDLETGEAETQVGTVEAQRANHSYVAAIGEGKAIGIAPLAGVGVEPDDDEQIVVYVYDRDELAVMTGALDADASATFTSGERSDFDATVELTMTEYAMSGTVTVGEEKAVEFTAELATGDAGVYWAHGATDDPDVTCDWVVLADGSQWGCVCAPPFRSPCCLLRS